MKVESIGQGRPLLYLHDWGFNSQVWNHQVDYLRGRFRNCLVNYNLPKVGTDVSHETLLVLLARRMRENWPGEPPHGILAHGFGAFLAYELIEQGWQPNCLALFGGLVRFTNGEGYLSGLAPEQVHHLRRKLHDSPQLMLAEYYHSSFSGEAESVPDELRDSMPLEAQEFLKVAFDAMISHDYTEMLADLPVRTLIFQGDADQLAPVWQGQLLRRLLKNSELYLCQGCGHVPFLSRRRKSFSRSHSTP